MAKLLPFHTRTQRAAAYALSLGTRWARVSKTQPWRPHRDPARLGNLLQQLALHHPAIVFVVENLVAEMVRQLETAKDHP